MLPLMILVFFFMLSSPATAAAFSIAKQGCDDRCGNVSIPYPFGTEKDCYRDKFFHINCGSSNNVGPPVPRLMEGNINVTNLSLDGQLRVSQFVAHDCCQENEGVQKNSPWISLVPPFTFNSSANKFTVIGCDTYSYVQGSIDSPQAPNHPRKFTTGCTSVCLEEDVVDGSCSGLGCCQTSIPNGTSRFDVTLNSFSKCSNVWDFNKCSYGFVVENNAFEFFADNLTNLNQTVSLPVIVDWVIEYKNCTEAQKNSSAYACEENSVCYDPDGALGYRCRCEDGYEGNPYLGCQDIDECKNSSLYKCAKNSVCGNTVGNYTCNCVKGYHGDGRGVDGCIENKYRPILKGVGVSTCTTVLIGLSFCLYLEFMRRKANRQRQEFFIKNGGVILEQKLSGQRGGGGGTYSVRIFSIEELQKVTNDFAESQIIGKGGFGTVFKGELEDNTIVAIKKSRGVDQHQVEQFINEVIVLSQINNRNVVRLLGCCLDTEVPLLVYEFIDNGTLFEHLSNKSKALKLSWKIRLQIASEVAGVLSYLHSVASSPIIHRDIKSPNILLDQRYTAKLADFGISRLVPTNEDQVSTMVQGTHGYLDPEYMQTGLLTEKSDVYSFGVVLVELLTGKKVLAFEKPEAERFLSNQFLSAVKGGHLIEVLDTNICCSENIEELKKVVLIANKCLNVKGDDRPYMKDVARELEAFKINANELSVQVLEIESSEFRPLDGMLSKEYKSCDDTSSSDLYPGYPSTTNLPMLPLSGGR